MSRHERSVQGPAPRARHHAFMHALSCRNLQEMKAERLLSADHTTIYRWVQHSTPDLDRRAQWCRSPHHRSSVNLDGQESGVPGGDRSAPPGGKARGSISTPAGRIPASSPGVRLWPAETARPSGAGGATAEDGVQRHLRLRGDADVQFRSIASLANRRRASSDGCSRCSSPDIKDGTSSCDPFRSSQRSPRRDE